MGRRFEILDSCWTLLVYLEAPFPCSVTPAERFKPEGILDREAVARPLDGFSPALTKFEIHTGEMFFQIFFAI